MLTVLTYNIQNGGHKHEDALHTIMTGVQPDLVLLQELYDERLLQLVAATLQADYFLARGNHRFQIGLVSRYPISAATSYHPWQVRNTILEATIALPTQRLHVWGVHLVPHLGLPFEAWRTAEVALLMQRTRRYQHQSCLIAGDWNAIAPGDRVLVHALPPALRRVVLAQGGRAYSWAIAAAQRKGWRDCYRAAHPNAPGWTLPSQRPNARLDYVFANPTLAATLHDCAVVTAPALVQTASDHLPLCATFTLPPSG